MQHVEAVVLNQRLDHQLIQVVLQETPRLYKHIKWPHNTLKYDMMRYLHGDLGLVQGSDVLHQNCNDELMANALQTTHRDRDLFIGINACVPFSL